MSTPTAEQLIQNSQGLVRSVAIKIHSKVPNHILLDDLIGYGQIGLAQAAQSFSADRGVSFSTFAYYRIRGEIYDGLSKMNWSSRSEAARIRREQKEAEVLEQQAEESESSGSKESLSAQADWLTTTTRRLAAVYLTTQSGTNEELGLEVADEHQTADSQAADLEIFSAVRDLVGKLPDPEGTLMKLAYYEGLSLTEIGQRFGKSKSWASRLHSRTLDHLSKQLSAIGAD